MTKTVDEKPRGRIGRPPGKVERRQQVAFRMPVPLCDRLEAEIDRISPDGIKIPRTALVLKLLDEALALREAATAKRGKK